jgi:hypothetical protein
MSEDWKRLNISTAEAIMSKNNHLNAKESVSHEFEV